MESEKLRQTFEIRHLDLLLRLCFTKLNRGQALDIYLLKMLTTKMIEQHKVYSKNYLYKKLWVEGMKKAFYTCCDEIGLDMKFIRPLLTYAGFESWGDFLRRHPHPDWAGVVLSPIKDEELAGSLYAHADRFYRKRLLCHHFSFHPPTSKENSRKWDRSLFELAQYWTPDKPVFVVLSWRCFYGKKSNVSVPKPKVDTWLRECIEWGREYPLILLIQESDLLPLDDALLGQIPHYRSRFNREEDFDEVMRCYNEVTKENQAMPEQESVAVLYDFPFAVCSLEAPTGLGQDLHSGHLQVNASYLHFSAMNFRIAQAELLLARLHEVERHVWLEVCYRMPGEKDNRKLWLGEEREGSNGERFITADKLLKACQTPGD